MRKKGTWKPRKRRLKQGLGFVLSAAMVMGLSGGSILTAYAAEDGADTVTALNDDYEVELEQDEDGYYLIYDENDILSYEEMIENGYEASSARLADDVTVSADTGFTGFGTYDIPYAGIFDGDGHTVTVSISTDGAAGLFAYVSGATIEDVTTAGTVTSSVNTYGCAGLVSYVMADGVTVKDCVNKADVNGVGYVAGLSGRCSATSVSITVADSSNEGSITSIGEFTGGIAAYIYNGSITACINYGAVSGVNEIGGIAGNVYNYGGLEISDCGNEGTVTGSSSATGGVVGKAYDNSLSNPLTLDGLYNGGNVIGTNCVGGIVGDTYVGVSNIYNTGAVSGTAVSTGGIVGYNHRSGAVLSNAYNAGEVTYTSSDTTYAGGLLVGSITSSGNKMYVDNAYYLSSLDGSVIASGSDYLYSNSTRTALTNNEIAAMAKTSQELQNLADTLGDSFKDNWVHIYHGGYPILSWEENGDDSETVRYNVSYNLTGINSDASIKAVSGSDYTAALTADNYYVLPDAITVSVNGTDLASGEGYAYDAESGSLTIYAAYITGDIMITAEGILTVGLSTDEDGYCLLYTENDILVFANLITDVSASLDARLMADITISADSGFSGIGTYDTPYMGTFDGEGHTVTLSMSTTGAAGFFAFVSGATIENVTTAGTVASSVNTYGCAGLVSCVMTDGGVTIKNCVNKADVNGVGSVAGLIGRDYGSVSSAVLYTVADSSNEGSITSTGSYTGGIAGYISGGCITGSINYGSVSGTQCTGGIVGDAYSFGNLEISDCGNEGTVTGSGNYTGGIAGYIFSTSSSVEYQTLDGLYNTGTITGTTYVGGIVGFTYGSFSNAGISNVYNTGSVSGTAVSTGGIVGSNRQQNTVLSNAYNAGEITYISSDTTYVGGLLIGSITSSSYEMYVENVYYLSTLDGSVIASGSSYLYSSSTGAVLTSDELGEMVKTSQELHNLAGTLGNAFQDNWLVAYHEAYPILSWEDNGADPDTVWYGVDLDLTGISSYGDFKAAAGSDYTVTLTPDQYYVLPESITVAVGGSELVSGEGYAYDSGSGLLTIYASYITGDIVITAVGIAPYEVSTNLENITSDGASKATVGSDYTTTLTPDEYYALPKSITVTIGETVLASGEGYTYDAENGLLTIYAVYVTGDIAITALGVATSYSVTTTLTNLSVDSDSRAAVGTDYMVMLSVENQYFTLPEGISVTAGGTELISGEGYSYGAENGSLTIYAASITGDIVITAAGVLSIDLSPAEDGCYLLYTEDDIMDFAGLVAYTSADLDARLMADITVSADSGFAGIGTSSAPYAGTFDGNGYTVTLSMSTTGAAGLFAYVSGATIENVTTAGTVASSKNSYGCAGLVSYVTADGVTVKNCVNKADVSGIGYVAGLIGRCSATSVSVTVADCSNEGSITSTSSYAGGIAAYIYNGSVTGCINYGAVSGTTYEGGIAGYAYSYGSLEISDCGNEGTVTGSSSYTGGIAGMARGSSSAPLTLDGLYNAGTVTGTTYVGGIVGRTYAGMSNVYNTGAVSGTAVSTGGIVGNNYLSGTVLSNVYNAGAVTYTSSDVTYAGGLLVGSITSSSYVMYVENAYYLSTLDGSAIASGSDYLYSNATQAVLTDDELAAMAKTSDELAALADTLGDRFVTNTDSDYHLGYPVLAWEVADEEGEGGGEEEVLNGLYAAEDGTLAYYVDGVIDTTFTGVAAAEDGTLYYVESGYVGSCTGLAKDASSGTWYYFTESVLDADYTGLVKNASNGILYYVADGTIGWDYTGMVKYAANGCWYYVAGGTIDWTYTGLAKNATNGIWYYIADGQLDWSYTGMVKHSNGVWYYVTTGQLDWSFTGDVTTENGTYHFENGAIVWDYTAA